MQNFLSGRKKAVNQALPKDVVKIADTNTALSKVEVVPTAGSTGTKVELVTENGEIQKIIVLCKCGERIELKCHY